MISKKYPKINTIYKRDNKGKITDEMVDNARLFKNFIYEGTEKIDGTNIRIEFVQYEWDSVTLNTSPELIADIEFGGRTDKAQIPEGLREHLKDIFTVNRLQDMFGENPIHVILYGEGYGAKIQKGGGLYRKDQGFILFDVDVKMDDGNFIALSQENVEDIATKGEIPFSPVVFRGTIIEAIEFVKNGQMSVVSEEEMVAEGIVLKQKDGLRDRIGNRLIFKVKIKDFK